jgi:ABC-type methionine transport system permease subunit
MNELTSLLWQSTLETLYMVAVAALFSACGGLALGLLLVLTRPNGILAAKWLNRFLETITNMARSIPFIILLVAIVPFTRFVVGTSIGTDAAIVPLVVGAIPYVARLIETALLEVDGGVIEAAVTLGATPWQIIWNVYLPEGLPALIRAVTIMSLTLISYSAMAGAVGGGGLGDLAIRYGYQRFRPDVMISTVAVLIIIVQTFQFAGNRLARTFERR